MYRFGSLCNPYCWTRPRTCWLRIACTRHYRVRSGTRLSNMSIAAAISGGVEQCRPDAFKLVHKAVSSAMTVVLETAHRHGSTGIEDALEGFLLLSRGAVVFDMPDLLDRVLVTLKQSMGLPRVVSPLPKAPSSPRVSHAETPTESGDRAAAAAATMAAVSSSPPSSSSSARPNLLSVSSRMSISRAFSSVFDSSYSSATVKYQPSIVIQLKNTCSKGFCQIHTCSSLALPLVPASTRGLGCPA